MNSFLGTITIPSVQGDKIIFSSYMYCKVCNSINIKKSARGKLYCGEICRKKARYEHKNNSIATGIMMDRCGGEVCVEY